MGGRYVAHLDESPARVLFLAIGFARICGRLVDGLLEPLTAPPLPLA